MSTHPADFRVEIQKSRPQAIRGLQITDAGTFEFVDNRDMDTVGEVLDITDRAPRDGMGSINRAAERDLLSFKTGDITLTLWNRDGYFTDLFAFFSATTVWGLRIFRRGEVQFYGVIIGPGSIIFDTKEKTVEVTVYGLSKLLDMQTAEDVRRAFFDMTVTTAIATQTTLTINVTSSLSSGDILHLTDHVNSEDVTIQQVTSGTAISLTSALQHTYAAGTIVECATKFWRFKTVSFLVEFLFKAGFIGISDFRLDLSQFSSLAPSPVNLQLLSIANDPRRGMSAMVGANAGLWNAAIHAAASAYAQDEPDEAWAAAGLADRGIYDWSPFYVQGNAGPTFEVYEPATGAVQEVALGGRFATYWGAVDYFTASPRIWSLSLGTVPTPFIERSTADGFTYGGVTTVALPVDTTADAATCGLDYDPVRNFVHVAWKQSAGTNRHFQYRDLGGAAWVDCKQASDAATDGYYGPRYMRDLDVTLVLRNATASSTGPSFTICAFQGATLLWERAFPSCLIVQEVAGNPAFYPTRTARYINGSIYVTLVSDGEVQLLRTDDQFQTYVMRSISPATTNTKIMACRIGDTYRIFCYEGANPTGYFICAPFYAGVIEYADFDGLSVAESLKKLSVLCNALPLVDDDLQGRFVARDLYDPGLVLDITDRVMERSDTLVWDETKQYVTVSGNDVEATTGDAGFSSDGIDLESSFIPNEAYAQALADDYFDFYSANRRMLEITVRDPDGHIYRPLDRVVIDGLRYMVYESDHNLTDDTVDMTLLEDV